MKFFDAVHIVDQLLQLERITGTYLRKDDPLLAKKLAQCQERIDALRTAKQEILNSGPRCALTKDHHLWDDGKCWCGRLLNESPIFVMPCCCRRMHLSCFERWVEQLRADAPESYVVCGIGNHFHTARRTCQCGSKIARFAEPKLWMEQQDKLWKDKVSGADVGDEGWLTDVALPKQMTLENFQWKDTRWDFFMP